MTRPQAGGRRRADGARADAAESLTRRFAAAGALAMTLAPLAAIGRDFGLGRPGIAPGGRRGVDESLRRTVSLVLRAEARSNGLPAFMTDPTPLSEAQMESLSVGGPLPEDIAIDRAPPGVDRRLPHARGSSIWVVAGTWMLEIDPARNRILSIAHDVLPPEL
jgi:hypothetical protein